jgi:hypothetical protein
LEFFRPGYPRNIRPLCGIRISQRHPEKTFTAGFERDDMLARGEYDPSKRHHAFLADRLANDRERLLADFAVGGEVIRTV